MKEIFVKICWQLKTPTPTWKCTCCIMQMSYLYASAFLSKLLQTRSTRRSNKKTLFGKRVMKHTHCRWEYTPWNHILICFYPVWTSKKMFFSWERELRKGLRDTLMRAAWYELLSTMANCGNIVKFLCLGISIITWVIILKQWLLFASGSWILVNIHQYSLRLRRIIVKY